MARDVISAPEGIEIADAYRMMMEKKIKILPVINHQGQFKGIFTKADAERIIENKKSEYNVGPDGSLRVGAAISVGPDYAERMELLSRARVDVVVVDCAHGWSKNEIDQVKACTKLFPMIDLVAGNISEPQAALDLVAAGAKGLRIGQGPGSICTTRIVAGVGTPQVTAVYNCAKALRDLGIPCCADGGIEYSGDITIALALGAESVMVGGLLAATTETPGDWINSPNGGARRKAYCGEGSLGMMRKSLAARMRYGQADVSAEKLVPEGVESEVEYKGDVDIVLYQLKEGLKSGMGYLGAKDIPTLHEHADFFEMTSAGLAESKPHGLSVIKTAPNYH